MAEIKHLLVTLIVWLELIKHEYKSWDPATGLNEISPWVVLLTGYIGIDSVPFSPNDSADIAWIDSDAMIIKHVA